MNVTLRDWMGVSRLLCGGLLFVTAACGSDRVSLAIDIPEPYRTGVDELMVHVLVPTPAAPFTCEDLAFDQVSKEALELSEVQQVTGRLDGDFALQDVPRDGTKLFLVEGFESAGLPLVSGCGSADTVSADVGVSIAMEPVPVIDSELHAFDQPLPDELAVQLTDQFARPMQSYEVQWDVVGPGGEILDGTALTNGEGRVVVRPELPTLPGPMALDIRARWLRDRPPSIPGFAQPTAVYSWNQPVAANDTRPSDLARAVVRVGRFGPNGEQGVALLSQLEAGNTRTLVMAYLNPATETMVERTRTVSGTLRTIAAVPLSDTRDEVVSAAPNQWLRYTVSQAGISETVEATTNNFTPTRLFPMDNCKGQNQTLLIGQVLGTAVVILDGGERKTEHPLDGLNFEQFLVHSGCVGSPGGDVHRVLVASGTEGAATLVAEIGGFRATPLPASANGIGFVRSVGGSQPHLLAQRTDGSGAAIARYLVDPNGLDRLDVELVDEDPTLFFPLATAGGDADGDGVADIFALNFAGVDEGLLGYRVFAALGVEHRGERLLGSGPPARAELPQVWLVDMNKDGRDDAVIATPVSIRVVLL